MHNARLDAITTKMGSRTMIMLISNKEQRVRGEVVMMSQRIKKIISAA